MTKYVALTAPTPVDSQYLSLSVLLVVLTRRYLSSSGLSTAVEIIRLTVLTASLNAPGG